MKIKNNLGLLETLAETVSNETTPCPVIHVSRFTS